MQKSKFFTPKTKRMSIDTRNMGINIDKNEYYTIVQSHTNYPQNYYSNTYFNKTV